MRCLRNARTLGSRLVFFPASRFEHVTLIVQKTEAGRAFCKHATDLDQILAQEALLINAASIFSKFFVSSNMYQNSPERPQVIVGSINMGYDIPTLPGIELTLFRPEFTPIPLGHNDGLLWTIRAYRFLFSSSTHHRHRRCRHRHRRRHRHRKCAKLVCLSCESDHSLFKSVSHMIPVKPILPRSGLPLSHQLN